MQAASTGYAAFHCRYHVQHKARHGSHWHTSYRAADLSFYVKAARRWVIVNATRTEVALALGWLEGLLASAGRVEPPQNLKRQPADYRGKVAFARLRERGVTAERILSIYLGMCALIEDDRGSHRTHEFKLVQVAKALHRLASGTHRRWEFDTGQGLATIRMDVYPRSSGLVLREMGAKVHEACGGVVTAALWPIIEAKRGRHGLHPSHLPGWQPLWQQQRKAA